MIIRIVIPRTTKDRISGWVRSRTLLAILLMASLALWGQLQQSGGAGSNASVGNNAATAPGSSTSAGGKVTTAAPTYTNNTMDALSLTTGGALRVDASATTQPVSGTVTANQGGSWTVLPGNTANTTPWFVKFVPLHGCAGNTLQDITQVDVATAAGSNLTTVDTCVFMLYLNNKTGSAVTATIQDRQGTPVSYSTSFSIPGNSDVIRTFDGMKFVTGVTVIAGTGSALNARLRGVQ